MSKIPGHFVPVYSDELAEDALFHYTTANGLIGILSTGEIWSTAYYCANDESELAAGKGILFALCRATTRSLIEANDPIVSAFTRRGLEIADHDFEEHIVSQALRLLCAYITCFCKPTSKEDFQSGLLSQWRGYGPDGGYALQFSRRKIVEAIKNTKDTLGLNYRLQDVHYTGQNPIKAAVFNHADAFVNAYKIYLAQTVDPSGVETPRVDPFASLTGEPLTNLLNYLVHTKNEHFREERECRLSQVQRVSDSAAHPPAQYFNRGGLLVPYTVTPRSSFNVLDCVDWIVIGPGPRMDARFNSVSHMIRQSGRNINVRASQIPFTRF